MTTQQPFDNLGDIVDHIVERIVFESRWLLLPFNLGLIVALFMYMLRFVVEDWFFVTHAFRLDLDDVLVLILGLVDCYMVANLIIMIAKGSFQIFIHKFNILPAKRPGWLDHIDTGLLKVKTLQSIASITGVALLKDFVNISHLQFMDVMERAFIHVVFLLSAFVMAKIWSITHGAQNSHSESIPIQPTGPAGSRDGHTVDETGTQAPHQLHTHSPDAHSL